MRHFIARGAGLIALVALAGTASAETVLGTPLAPPALNADVTGAVAKRFTDAGGLVFKDLKPSKARGGKGYCGKVAAAADAPFVPFQVILDAGAAPSVLLLSDADGASPAISEENATLLLRNAGCLE